MVIDSDVDAASLSSTTHGVAVCHNSTSGAYYYFFTDDNTRPLYGRVTSSLAAMGYDDIRFVPFTTRDNWRLYHPNASLVENEENVLAEIEAHNTVKLPTALSP